MTVRISARVRNVAAVERLVSTLPDSYGDETTRAEYVSAAERLPTYLAWEDATVVGALLLDTHFPTTSEIHLLVVDPERQRQGIGRSLVDAAETEAADGGTRLLEAKTLGPSIPHEGYATARAFYQAMGFLPVEELTGASADNPCLLMVKPLPEPGPPFPA